MKWGFIVIIEEITKKVKEMIEEIDKSVKYGDWKFSVNEANAKFFAMEVGKLIFNKSVLSLVLDCLNPNSMEYNCFEALDPILVNYYPNRKDWLPLFSFLLVKAKKNGRGNELSVYTDFLDNIIDDNGVFLPYLLTNEDRIKMGQIGMNSEQISVISKYCRSLYRKENPKVELEPEVKKRTVVDIASLQRNAKIQKQQLWLLKRFISLDDNEIIVTEFITPEEESTIISLLEELHFDSERIDFIKNKIKKFNESIQNGILMDQINNLKNDLFTEEMHGKYDVAMETISDATFVYKNIKEELQKQIDLINSILYNCVNGTESYDDTCEYLIMAFEDLNSTLKLCGPVRKRTL